MLPLLLLLEVLQAANLSLTLADANREYIHIADNKPITLTLKIKAKPNLVRQFPYPKLKVWVQGKQQLFDSSSFYSGLQVQNVQVQSYLESQNKLKYRIEDQGSKNFDYYIQINQAVVCHPLCAQNKGVCQNGKCVCKSTNALGSACNVVIQSVPFGETLYTPFSSNNQSQILYLGLNYQQSRSGTTLALSSSNLTKINIYLQRGGLVTNNLIPGKYYFQNNYSIVRSGYLIINYTNLATNQILVIAIQKSNLQQIGLLYFYFTSSNKVNLWTIIIISFAALSGGFLIGCLIFYFFRVRNNGQNRTAPIPRSDPIQLSKKFPMVSYQVLLKLKFNNNHTADDNECIICLQNFKNQDNVAVLFCSHFFHQKCLVDWLSRVQNCPYCRQSCQEQNVSRDRLRMNIRGNTPQQLVRTIFQNTNTKHYDI